MEETRTEGRALPQRGEDRRVPAAQAPSWEARLDRIIETLGPKMVEVRRYLHQHPEPSGEEFGTTRYLREQLTSGASRLELADGPGGRGLVASQIHPPSQSEIAFRADIDALWIHDAKDVPYRSRVDGVMHACGHDAHSAVVLGASLALQRAEADGVLPWPLRWRAIFQPSEETSRGAHEMVEHGALVGASAILGLHVDPSRPIGTIGVKDGVLTATCDEMRIHIEGRGGHSARPHESIDPIAAAAQLISSIYLFVPRAVDSQDPVVVTIGTISGGQTPNVIPEEVTLGGTLRTFGGGIRDRTKDHIRQLARGLGETSGARIRVDFLPGPDSVRNDPQLTDILRRAGSSVLGPAGVVEIERPSMGGEDFAFYLDRTPGSMFRLGCRASPDPGPTLHSPSFDIDERALAIGARILTRAAILWSNPNRREEARPR